MTLNDLDGHSNMFYLSQGTWELGQAEGALFCSVFEFLLQQISLLCSKEDELSDRVAQNLYTTRDMTSCKPMNIASDDSLTVKLTGAEHCQTECKPFI